MSIDIIQIKKKLKTQRLSVFCQFLFGLLSTLLIMDQLSSFTVAPQLNLISITV